MIHRRLLPFLKSFAGGCATIFKNFRADLGQLFMAKHVFDKPRALNAAAEALETSER